MNARPLSSTNCPHGWNYDCSNDYMRAVAIAPRAFEWFAQFSEQMGRSFERKCALAFYDPDGRFVHGIQFEGVQPNHLLGLAYNLFWLPDLHTACVLVKGADWQEAYRLHLPAHQDFFDWPYSQSDLPGFCLDPANNLYVPARALWGFRQSVSRRTSNKRLQSQPQAKQAHSKPSQLQMQGV